MIDRIARVDTHIHTAASYDCESDPEAVLNCAERAGLDAIVVTDHDTTRGAMAVRKYATDRKITVIIGCEVSTADGHLLAIGIEEAPEPGRPLHRTAVAIREQGGIAVVPHPFQRSKHGACSRAMTDVDGIEVHNAHTVANIRNGQAKEFAERMGYPGFGGSDAHRPENVGLAATEVTLDAGRAVTPRTLLDAMRDGRTNAVGRRTSTYRYLRKLISNAWLKSAALL